MTVKSTVSFVKSLPAGATIGYGRTYTLSRPSVIATVPVGYADGVNRRLSNVGYMLVGGGRAPIVGRVCMDQVMLDVTDLPPVKVGDEVTVFGGKDLPDGTGCAVGRYYLLRAGLQRQSADAAPVMCATKSESALKTLSLIYGCFWLRPGSRFFICKGCKSRRALFLFRPLRRQYATIII